MAQRNDDSRPPWRSLVRLSDCHTWPVLLLLTVLAGVLTLSAPGCTATDGPIAEDGHLTLRDLRTHDLSTARLSGLWRIRPMDLDARWIDEPLPDDSPTLDVPGSWEHLMPRYGYATLELVVELPHEEPRPYLIHTELGGSAHALYADGDLVLERGDLGTSVEQVDAEWSDTIGRVGLGGTSRLVWRIANFHHTPGGVQAAPDLGPPEAIRKQQRLLDALYFGVAGALFLIGLYHLLIWGLRRREHASLWFGLLSVIMALRFPVVDHVLTNILPGNYNELEGTLSYLTFYLGVPTLAFFIDSMFPRRWFRYAKWAALAVGLLFSVPVLLLDQHHFAATLPWYQGWTFLIGALVIVRAVQIIGEGETGAYLFGLGALAVITAGFHDILWNQRILSLSVTVTPLAMLVFVVAQALAIGRRYAEAQRTAEHLGEHLQDEVDAKTAKLREAVEQERQLRDQLTRALEQAEAAGEAKSQFLANMSHELRTPLNGVVGMAELMLRSGLRGQHRQFARTILRSGESLLAIINDILDFAKVEAGELEIDETTFDLPRSVEQVIELLAPQADDKGVELVLDVAPAVPVVVHGDPERLRQVLINLVGNAVKFTEEGEVVVTLTASEPSEATGDAGSLRSVGFEVRDTGIGMTDEQIDRVFEAFVQADISTTRRYGGTGLGLAISRHIVQLMGGALHVDSEPSVGSTFRFELDFDCPTEADSHRFELPEQVRDAKILAVQPNPSARHALDHLLEAHDIAHDLAADLESATALLERADSPDASNTGPYDVALLDADALSDDPLKFSENTGARPPWSDQHCMFAVPLSYWKHHPNPENVTDAHFVTKPLRASNLFESLTECLGLEPPPEKLDATGPSAGPPPTEPARKVRGKILVADDNAINRRVTARLLETLGYDYDAVTDGQQAVDAFQNDTYDAILLDCQMPKMDGAEAARRIRELEGHEPAGRHIPILAISAGTAEHDAARARAAGMDDFIAKPIGADQLQKVLAEWLAPSSGAATG